MKCCKTIGDGIGIFAHETFPLVRLVLAFTELPCVSELELTEKSDLSFTAGPSNWLFPNKQHIPFKQNRYFLKTKTPPKLIQNLNDFLAREESVSLPDFLSYHYPCFTVLTNVSASG
jgi:hypothetical protein